MRQPDVHVRRRPPANAEVGHVRSSDNHVAVEHGDSDLLLAGPVDVQLEVEVRVDHRVARWFKVNR